LPVQNGKGAAVGDKSGWKWRTGREEPWCILVL
jgi:hypothetical protein